MLGSVWRPLIDSVEDWPLAVCDGQTVNGSDLVETDHVRRQYSGSTLYLMRNPNQRFYYMSKQSKDEVLIFKNFDSQPEVKATCKLPRHHLTEFYFSLGLRLPVQCE